MKSMDVALLLFNASSPSSFLFAQDLERELPDTLPRLYVATHSDAASTGPGARAGGEASALAQALVHCQEQGSPEPLPLSVPTHEGVEGLMAKLLAVAHRPNEGVPCAIQERRKQELFHRRVVNASTAAALVLG
eukprot:CAMPEP_0198436572 /NCGR_PEP_ID=MMETSP1452-20131203/43129_1 /TAXON_ID=1181717 /ORGANISM="Synchroma pusillum, Strain CCMP3072" /LENGTH=133 /DNA_ID=CAMNT_0044157133 /DNA_START=47 /DNA_END=445 /DNA_ORIENTATION=-